MNKHFRLLIAVAVVFSFLLRHQAVALRAQSAAYGSAMQPETVFPGVTDSVAAITTSPADSFQIRERTGAQQAYYNQDISPRQFDMETYKKLTDGLDYSGKPPEEEPVAKEQHKEETTAINISQQTLRLIAFVMLFTVLIILLLKAFGFQFYMGRKKDKQEQDYVAATPEENGPAQITERLLQEAIQQRDFRLAVRLYYLMLIKALAAAQLIRWQKEKTNFDYVHELHSTTAYGSFREATLLFEQVWYGELPITEQHFDALRQQFHQLLAVIKSSS